jgi:hypothetical protein
MHASIVDIHEKTTRFLNSPHGWISRDVNNILNYILSPTLDEMNGHGFFEDNWLKCYNSRDNRLHEIGVKMLEATTHHHVYWDDIVDCEELEWFIEFYGREVIHNNQN